MDSGLAVDNRDDAGASLLEAENLTVEFTGARSMADLALGRHPPAVRAVDNVSLSVTPGEVLGLVGESGSGKTTIGRAIMGLHKPSAGHILFNGRDLKMLTGPEQRDFKRQVQMVFQDPYSSLNPRISIGGAVAEVLMFHRIVAPDEVGTEVDRLFGLVGLLPGMKHRRPASLSGGQRQRVGLARALAVRPRFMVLDEPVAALDVSIQAQILNLLRELRHTLDLSMLLIAHELGVVRYMSDRIAVMYLGQIMEIGTTAEIFGNPRHPYTQGLLKAAPSLAPVKRQRDAVFHSDIPSPLNIPTGCRFRTRCPRAAPVCTEAPPEVALSPTHMSRCHFSQS